MRGKVAFGSPRYWHYHKAIMQDLQVQCYVPVETALCAKQAADILQNDAFKKMQLMVLK